MKFTIYLLSIILITLYYNIQIIHTLPISIDKNEDSLDYPILIPPQQQQSGGGGEGVGDEGTEYPILLPQDQNNNNGQEFIVERPRPDGIPVEDDEEQGTEYPILLPPQDQIGNEQQQQEYIVERPRPDGIPVEDDEEIGGGEEEEHEIYGDLGPIPRPRPEGNEIDNENNAEVVFPGFIRLTRDAARTIEDDEDEDDIYSDLDEGDDVLGGGPIQRPYPEYTEENIDTHETDEDLDDGDSETIILKPKPDGDEYFDDEDNAKILYPRITRRKRDNNGDNNNNNGDNTQGEADEPGLYGGDDDNDTVVIEPASCEQLLQKCNDEYDPLACAAYHENCSENSENPHNQQINEIIGCVNDGKYGSLNPNCPPILQ